MDYILQFIQFFVDLGASVMLPIIITIVALAVGEKFGKALKSGISVGIGFVGIDLVIGLMNTNLGAAADQMSQRWGLSLTVVDIGWPGTSPMVWSQELALIAIPIAILVNIIMLVMKKTKVVNIDIWNIWHFAFTGVIVQIATGSIWMAILAIAIHSAIAYKLGDWTYPVVKDYFGLEGIAIPHGTSATLAPLALPFEVILNKIPKVKNIDISAESVQHRFGVFGDPAIIGATLGVIVGILAGYDVSGILTLGIQMAAVIILMPQVVKHIMNGLLPVAEKAKVVMNEKFSGSDYIIGMDPALLLGDSNVVSASLIFIPVTIIIAVLMPGNVILPFGDLATIGFFVAMAVGIHRGNLFRTLISGTFIMTFTLWIANQMIEYQTILAQNSGMMSDAGAQVAALDQGGNPITYVITQIFNTTDVVGLIVIGVIYFGSLIFMYTKYKTLGD